VIGDHKLVIRVANKDSAKLKFNCGLVFE